MGAVAILFGVGIIFIGGGFFWRLFDDIITTYFSVYIYDPTDIYFLGSQLVWDAIPYLLLFIGVLIMIMAGLVYRSESEVAG